MSAATGAGLARAAPVAVLAGVAVAAAVGHPASIALAEPASGGAIKAIAVGPAVWTRLAVGAVIARIAGGAVR